MDVRNSRILQVVGVAALLGLLFAAGCASSKVTAKLSGEKIFQADKAVLEAKDGNASVNAKEELGVAEEKLAKAKEAFAKENYEDAANLAEMAVVDAEYAGARATTRKKANMVEETRKDNDALRQEIRQMAQ